MPVFCGEIISVYGVYALFEKLTRWKSTLNDGTQYAKRMLYATCVKINEDLRSVQDQTALNKLKINSQKSQCLIDYKQHLLIVSKYWDEVRKHYNRRLYYLFVVILSLESGHYTTLLFSYQWK